MTGYKDVTGLILAGGAGRRLGGVDKGLMMLDGKPLVQHVLDAITLQVAGIVISANRNLQRYRELGHPVIEDGIPGYPGPLAGIAGGLDYAATRYLATVPCDTPNVPQDLVPRLYDALLREHAKMAVVHDGQRLQHLHLLCETALLGSVSRMLDAGELKVAHWVEAQGPVIVDFSDCTGCFDNINLPGDLEDFQARR
jgi:molybdopterin-guanine dinucleotide biosynthesis protein A